MGNKYYVYAHKYLDRDGVFYVGKGSGGRRFKTCNRSTYWKRLVAKYGFKSFVLEDNLTEEEALKREVYWIAHYKSTGQCEANLTNGGDSVRVDKRWWGDKISKALTGIKRKSGRESKSFKDFVARDELYEQYVINGKSSVEIGEIYNLSYGTVLERLREFGIAVKNVGRLARPIRCTTDGIEFQSINDAAKHYGLFRENIRKVLNGEYRHTGGKSFVYVTDDREVSGSTS